MLEDSTIAALQQLVKKCTARVRGPNQRAGGGTAFFIDDRHLITCKHVVKANKLVDVEPYERASRPGKVIAEDTERDLALLEIEPVEGEPAQPAVALHEALAQRGRFLLAGYPQDPQAPGGLEVREYSGGRRDDNSGRLMNLALDAGENVTFGQSGGALVDVASGAVVAIARYSKAPKGILGGGCVPISTAAACFDLVRRHVDYPPNAVREWRDALGEAAWIDLYHVWTMRTSLDVHVGGSRNRWRVDVEKGLQSAGDDKDPVRDGTIEDLGDGVAEVFFEWAHRSEIHSASQVKLFGRLLSEALFRPRLKGEFETALPSDETVVRLLVEGTELVDVPWELAALPDGDESFLATDKRVRLVRAADLPERPPPQAPSASARAIGIVVKSEESVNGVDGSHGDAGYLKAAMYSGAIVAPELEDEQESPLENPGFYEAECALGTPVEIVHYQGYGRYAATPGEGATAELAFIDDNDDMRWVPAARFLDSVASSGARLLVLEFLTPPRMPGLERIPTSALMAIQSTEAMVFTSAPIQSSQARVFNEHFYRALGKYRTVAEAVQEARRVLMVNSPANDYAGFGWFTLAMRGNSDMRIASPTQNAPTSSRASTEQTPREPAISSRPARGPAKVGDGFAR